MKKLELSDFEELSMFTQLADVKDVIPFLPAELPSLCSLPSLPKAIQY